MTETNVTREEINEIKAQTANINKRLTEINNNIIALTHAMEIRDHTFIEQGDVRWVCKKDFNNEIINALNNPNIENRLNQSIESFIRTNKAKDLIKLIFDDIVVNKRDNTTKWLNFFKLVFSILGSGLIIYILINLNQIKNIIGLVK